jgi:hypothetical protein
MSHNQSNSAPPLHGLLPVGADEPDATVSSLADRVRLAISRQELIGKRVLCERIGRKAEFVGIVIRRHPGNGRLAYVVRDEKRGSHWHREPSEFVLHEEEAE